MRIIAGINRGRKLQTLEGLSTRPTLDGTKEAIFSSLGGMLPGFVVLDVFGGSGALSLESISRGAKKAYILDNNLDAIEIIKKNAQTLNSMKELTILYGDYCVTAICPAPTSPNSLKQNSPNGRVPNMLWPTAAVPPACRLPCSVSVWVMATKSSAPPSPTGQAFCLP